MSNNTGSGQDYTDPHTHSFATEGAAAPEVKKPNPVIKMVIIIAGVLFLAIAGFVGWGFLSKKPAQAPAQQIQPAKPAPEPEAKPVEPAAEVTPPVDPSAALVLDTNGDGIPDAPAPASDPAALVIDTNGDGIPDAPAPAPAVDPSVDVNGDGIPDAPVVDPNAALAPPVAPVADPSVQPSVVDPSAPAAAPVIPATPAPAVEPTPVAAPAVVSPPPVAVVQDPANSSIGQVMDTARQEMMSALDRIEKRLMSLEGRVSALENRPASSTASTAPARAVASKPPVRRAAPKKPAKKVAKPYVAPASQNRLEIIDSSYAPVSRAIIIERGSAPTVMDNRIQVIDAPVVEASSNVGCRIQSIKPGRAWVRRADGSFASFGVGDSLPNGAVVDSIDPDTGVIANGRIWNCN